MAEIDFLSAVHRQTTRDYVARVTAAPKADCATAAKKWGVDYWDGARTTGYGGYKYDGRWRKVASALAAHYQLKAGDRVLDVGCGKAFLLYDLLQEVPGIEIAGIDISSYALEHAMPAAQPYLQLAHAKSLPFADQSFDLVISINTLHNLYCFELDAALREIVRVAKRHAYICVESYRSEAEKANLLYWQLTCETFCTPEEWQWWFDQTGYQHDHSFIYFE